MQRVVVVVDGYRPPKAKKGANHVNEGQYVVATYIEGGGG
jgi:hypothetical protein